MALSKEQVEAYNNAVNSSADDLRDKGLWVVSHYDRRLTDGPDRRVWIMGFDADPGDTERMIEGRGTTDAEALNHIRGKYAELTDHLHHAPACPANHYHGGRAPTGPCTCGAKAFASKQEAVGKA